MCYNQAGGAVALIFAALLLSGCDDSKITGPPTNAASTSSQAATASAGSSSRTPGDLVTQSPQQFADALQAVGNENEVLVALKDASAPRVASASLKERASGSVISGVPETPGNAPRRSAPGFAESGRAAYNGVMQALKAESIEPYRAHPEAEIMSVRIPEAKLVPVLAALMQHPNVDYVEANQKRKVVLDGTAMAGPRKRNSPMTTYSDVAGSSTPVQMATNPEGTNDPDLKHTFHNVLEAWDYTRGSGAEVGILDSGFAYDQGTGEYHSDGDLVSSSEGIKKVGFVDDYDDYNNCDENGGQPYGNCVKWDDHGHGTRMAGLVGANDNDQGYVGVMPEGVTVSMKIAANCNVSGEGGCGDDTFRIEDDDFYWAVNWTSQNTDIGVLSMSFGSTGLGSIVESALYDAYNEHDILLLSGERNPSSPSDQTYPQKKGYVMGIGGISPNGSNHGKDKHQEVSALAGGGTTGVYCPSQDSFCGPNGPFYYFSTSGGTSAATAITAGIAGLVRSHNPGLSAQQVRQRLDRTTRETHGKVDALAAVTGEYPIRVSISGPDIVDTGELGTWTASASDYDESTVTYTWEWDGTQVKQETVSAGSGSSYSRTPYESDSHLLRVRVSSGSENNLREKGVFVRDDDCESGFTC